MNMNILSVVTPPSIYHNTPVPTSKHRANVGISCNKTVRLAKFYHKYTFGSSISTFIKSIGDGHFATWPNLTSNLIQKNIPKITTTSKGHLYQVYQNVQSNKNFKPPAFPIINKDPGGESIIKEDHI